MTLFSCFLWFCLPTFSDMFVILININGFLELLLLRKAWNPAAPCLVNVSLLVETLQNVCLFPTRCWLKPSSLRSVGPSCSFICEWPPAGRHTAGRRCHQTAAGETVPTAAVTPDPHRWVSRLLSPAGPPVISPDTRYGCRERRSDVCL